MDHPIATEYYEIIVDDPVLTKRGFRKFLLPMNGNGTTAAARMVVHNTDKRKMMYPKFYKSDLDKTVQALREEIVSDGKLIDDDDTAYGLVAYFRNAGVLLSEDEDSPFFKNGYGNGNGKAKDKPKSKKARSTNQQQKQRDEESSSAAAPADYNIIISFEQWQTKLLQKYDKLSYQRLYFTICRYHIRTTKFP